MSTTAKYHVAPTSDPEDHLSYSQAPPSYQAAEGTTAANVSSVLGAPRSDGDNVPDDFKFGGSVAEATTEIRNIFIRKVYSILTVQLLVTAVMSALSFWSTDYRMWIQARPVLVWLGLFGAMLFLALTCWKRHSYPANLFFLSGFTLLEAYTISVLVSFFESNIVLNAAILTGGIFVFLTAFAFQSKYDFSSWLPYLGGALWGIVIFGFMYMFLPHSSVSELLWGLLGALIFCGYILVDTQRILRHHHVEEEIVAAISLYLDIINLFLSILRILNSQRDN